MNQEQKAIQVIRDNGYIVHEGGTKHLRFQAEIYTSQGGWIGAFTDVGLIHFAELIKDMKCSLAESLKSRGYEPETDRDGHTSICCEKCGESIVRIAD